ncbi:hypothetical protein [Haloarcula salinisoli]|uniref:Uncharacterized protein n=1 Tax=Haloarcula salinisoli TaxID=2487746 RepID=A0A8J8C6B7_9EURY|nr:hypothetical protein [Halomicroarcula salinisoli]MBX0286371.1 hypothetical protein [Halomicroarcula salinisoli]MBX0302141.1 hypothetical protein [Halomicroarcula salinisoli]
MTENPGSDGLELPADATDVRDEQVRRALRQLDERGDLTPQQRATVERLADRLIAQLLRMFDADPETIEVGDAGDWDDGIALFSD